MKEVIFLQIDFLNMRGEKLNMLMGSNTIKNIISKLDDDIEFINRERLSKLNLCGS